MFASSRDKIEPSDSPGTVRSGPLILVVDDEEVVRDVAREALKRTGYAVMTAASGQAGVDSFRRHQHRIRAVLLDATMPDLSGREVFSRIKEIRGDAAVILSSGYAEHDATRDFAAGELAAFVQKPYTPGELVETVRTILDSKTD